MFESVKIKKNNVINADELIDKYINDYHLCIYYRPNGELEIFVGSKREDERSVSNGNTLDEI